MASLIVFSEAELRPPYWDRKSGLTEAEYRRQLDKSSTVYVGKYAFRGPNTASEAQIYTVFSQCGQIKRIIMGINSFDSSPAGFCFVEFFERKGALAAVRWLHDTFLGGRKIRVDMDLGFSEGRQFGRGDSGYQKYDERTKQGKYGRKYDEGRDIGEESRRHKPLPTGRGGPALD
jgi:nuclear cap-binding protein subunit 2